MSEHHPCIGKIPWRTDPLPTLVFWPGEFHGLYSPWGRKESDTTKRLPLSFSLDIGPHVGTSDPRLSSLEKKIFFWQGRLSFLVAIANVHSHVLCRWVLFPPGLLLHYCCDMWEWPFWVVGYDLSSSFWFSVLCLLAVHSHLSQLWDIQTAYLLFFYSFSIEEIAQTQVKFSVMIIKFLWSIC